jgi:hypothetical protein
MLTLHKGDLITLSTKTYVFEMDLLVDMKSSSTLTLARPTQPYHLLSVSEQSLHVTFTPKTNPKSNIFELITIYETSTHLLVHFRCFAHSNDRKIFLGINKDMEFVTITNDDLEDHTFILTFANKKHNVGFTLHLWQQQRFVLEGWLHLTGAMPIQLIDEALQVINIELGRVGSLQAGGAQVGFGKLGGSLSNNHTMRALVTQGVLPILESFLGENNIDVVHISAQIALRFPQTIHEKIEWHTDGLRQGRRHNFSLLLGVCLQDINTENSGNLLLWPGSHILIHKHTINSFGAIDYESLQNFVTNDVNTLFAGVMTSDGTITKDYDDYKDDIKHNNEPTLPHLGKPLTVCAKKGDIVLLHPDLAHTGGPNYSSLIRYMVYFRLRKRSGTEGWAPIAFAYEEDMWYDISGVQQVAQDLKGYINKLYEI